VRYATTQYVPGATPVIVYLASVCPGGSVGRGGLPKPGKATEYQTRESVVLIA